MKTIIITVFLFFSIESFTQNVSEETGTINFFAGIKTRVTPIHVKRISGYIYFGNINIFEQPGMHLTGPGISISEKIILENNWSVILNQTIRYDYFYQEFPLVNPEPPDFKYTIRKKTFFDLYADLAKKIPSKKSSCFSLFIGVGLCGLNSGFDQTLRIYSTQTSYTDYITRKNFIFPAISGSLGWQWKKLYAELKMGYCWNDPTLFDTPFLFPEVSCQYQIFSSHKKKD